MNRWSRCALCPRLCRSACPVSLGSGREAAVPAVMAGILLQVERGEVPDELAAAVSTLCTDCGACQEHCHLDTPHPEALRELRRKILPRPPIEPLFPIVGTGQVVAIESDERRWAGALGAVLGLEVRSWKTTDDLGVAALHFEEREPRNRRIREAVGTDKVVVISGGVAAVLDAAGVAYSWLRENLPQLPGGLGSCQLEGPKPLACCGGAGPLLAHHPEDALRVGQLWLDRAQDWSVGDARCRAHLRGCGGRVTDPVDALLAGDFVR